MLTERIVGRNLQPKLGRIVHCRHRRHAFFLNSLLDTLYLLPTEHTPFFLSFLFKQIAIATGTPTNAALFNTFNDEQKAIATDLIKAVHEQRTADDAYYRSIYLIEGMAGSGKSYIVRTLTKMLPEVKVFETPFVRHLMTDSSPATVYQSLNLRLVTIDMYLGDVIDEVARHELARFHGKHVEASNHPLHACTITDMCQAMAPAVNRRKQAGEDVPVFNEETVRDTMRFTLENIEDYDRRTLAYGQQYETHPVLPTQATVFAIEQARK